ncbi:MAG: hypothetical protein JOY67_18930, partial [Hyphomicrobiales bacterium]|nr:hypothetical protein [Hyphomicrobiales bacterium]
MFLDGPFVIHARAVLRHPGMALVAALVFAPVGAMAQNYKDVAPQPVPAPPPKPAPVPPLPTDLP